MSTKSETYSAILSKTLRKDSSRASKSVKQEAKALIEEGKIGRKVEGASSTPAGKLNVLGAFRKGSAPRAASRKTEDILARFDSDVELKNAVERGRDKAITPDLTERERSFERFKRVAADNPKSVNALLSFGLEMQQARTLEQMLGQLFGQPIKIVGSAEARKAQDAANKLIASMKGHWDSALPKGETQTQVLKSAFDQLKTALKIDPNLNPSRFIRKQLFDPWRKRFMQRLGADSALAKELRAATGIEIAMDSEIPRFSLKLKIGRSQAFFGFDVDHAETRLSDAVRNAKRPEDLLSVIDSEGMQLLSPRENRTQIEALRKASREYFDNADEATLDYFRRNGTSATALNSDIDKTIAVLDGAGETF
jgi:hypothetical protein